MGGARGRREAAWKWALAGGGEWRAQERRRRVEAASGSLYRKGRRRYRALGVVGRVAPWAAEVVESGANVGDEFSPNPPPSSAIDELEQRFAAAFSFPLGAAASCGVAE